MIDFNNKLTEDETVELLMKFLNLMDIKSLTFVKDIKEGLI